MRIRTAIAILLVLIVTAAGAAAAERPVVTTAIVPDYKPYTFANSAGEPDGFVVELAREVCSAAGLTLKITIARWPEAREGLENGRIDFLPMVAYSVERDRIFDFTSPHTIGFDAIFTRRGGAKASQLADLRGLRVAALNGDAAWEYLVVNGLVDKDKLISKPSFDEVLQALDAGEVDAAVGPKLVGLEKAEDLGLTRVQTLGGLLEEYRRPFSFAVKEGNLALVERLNQGLLLTQKSGEYKRLRDKWFSSPEGGVFSDHPALPWLLVAFAAALLGVGALYVFNRRLDALVKRKTAEALTAQGELAAEREHAARFLEIAEVMIVALDREGRFSFVNRKTCEVLGYTEAELLGQNCVELIVPPDERTRIGKVVEDLLAGERAGWSYVENRVRTKSGQERLIAWRNTFLRDATGVPIATFSSGEDITARRQALELLAASEERFRGLFANMTEAFALHEAVVDQTGKMTDYRFLEVNPAFESATGLKALNILGMKQSEVLPIEDPFWVECYSKVVETGEPVRVEHYSPQLNKHFEVYAYRNAPGQFVSLFHDVTTRRELELQLQQAQKMEALGTLAGGIAHDFNNILGAILGYAELSLPLAGGNAELRENLGEISSAGARARDLTRQILAFSRKGTEVPQPVDITLIVKEACKLLRSTVPSTIHFTLDLPKASTACVLATPVQLHQVVMNLGTNAYHALKTIGGTVEFAVDVRDIGHEEAEKLLVNPGRYVRFTVTDDGPGIPPQILPNVFEPFFTTKPVGEGTGLGLAAVRSIARTCHGAAIVEAPSEGGTRLSVYFPAIEEAAGESDAAPGAGDQTLSGSVLVVDDETTLAKLIAKMLSRRGLKTEWRDTSSAVLAELVENPAKWDVVITDQTMPGLSGAQLLERAREAGLMQPFVVCTGYSDVLNAEDAERRGFFAYMKKPVKYDELIGIVEAALKSRM